MFYLITCTHPQPPPYFVRMGLRASLSATSPSLRQQGGGLRGWVRALFYINLSLFCRLKSATSRNSTDPVMRMILFLKVTIAQVVSFVS